MYTREREVLLACQPTAAAGIKHYSRPSRADVHVFGVSWLVHEDVELSAFGNTSSQSQHP